MAFPMLELWCGPSAGEPDNSSARREAPGELDAPFTPLPSDAELVARIQAHDATALDLLMQAHTAALWRFAYGYVPSRPVTQEIVQDVFVALWELGPRWNISGTIRGYLFAAVRNRALNVRKHDARMRRFERNTAGTDDIPAMGAPAASPEGQLLLDEQRALLTRAVAALPWRWRQAITLRIHEQLSYDEIAVALGVSAGAARKLVERAQRELRRLLIPYLDQT